MMRTIVMALVLALAAGAQAQTVTPPAVPQLPDEPLPEWHPPPKRSGALFLSVSPEVQSAQHLRQAGLWISSAGWAQLLLAGILYGWAADVNDDVGHPRANGTGMVNSSGDVTQNSFFDPALEDKRNRIEMASATFIGIGGAMAVGGFVLYTIGQWKITVHHKTHPQEPLPPLSGF
jgi:hypothetical protein